ncbi:MAG TPA: cell division protein FtsB [Steroidobacteraceae bacterium]
MRLFAAILLMALLALQYRLWLSDDGVREVRRLENAVVAQERENDGLTARNAQLAAEVENLKKGLDAVEERARSDLGMVGANETFYQVVIPAPESRTDVADTEAAGGTGATTESLPRDPLSRSSQHAAAR